MPNILGIYLEISMAIPTIKKHFQSIFNSVSRLVEDKYFFQEFQKLAQAKNSSYQQNEFLHFIALNYIEAATLGVFRQVDRNRKSQSLRNVLMDIDANYKLFTYRRFSAKYSGFMHPVAKRDFQQFAIKNGSRIDRRKLIKDIAELKRITKPIVKYRHKVVAHKNKRPIIPRATITDLFTAIDFVEKLTIKYYLLLNQGGMATLLAGNAQPNLQAIFK